MRGLRRDHRPRAPDFSRLFSWRERGKAAAIALRRMLHAQIGLARIETLLGPFSVSLVAIAAETPALTAAARTGLLPSAAGLARAAFATSHEDPRSRRSFAQ